MQYMCGYMQSVYQPVSGHQDMIDGSGASYLCCRGICIRGSSAVDFTLYDGYIGRVLKKVETRRYWWS